MPSRFTLSNKIRRRSHYGHGEYDGAINLYISSTKTSVGLHFNRRFIKQGPTRSKPIVFFTWVYGAKEPVRQSIDRFDRE